LGVLRQPVMDKMIGSLNQPFPSVRMSKLFYEFLGRYNDWRIAKIQETIVALLVLILGLSALFIHWLLPNVGMALSFVVLVLFYFATRHYLEVNERVYHLYVNVHILHHHLIGKLEVGFCDHPDTCHCVENFRCYVMRNYSISLDNRSLR
jgi:hypothetical protein